MPTAEDGKDGCHAVERGSLTVCVSYQLFLQLNMPSGQGAIPDRW
jgi:hypothetical protein